MNDSQNLHGREAALALLKQEINAQRARIDPRVLKIAEHAARLQQMRQQGVTAAKGDNKLIPYDRESAAEAVSLFLQNSPHPERTRELLLELLKRKQD